LRELDTAPRSSPLRRFLWARFTGQVALNAVLYALLIAVVERSESSVASTLLVASFIAPSIILGVPGGIVADVLPRRVTLVGSLLLRAALALALATSEGDLATLYLLVVALATVGQAYGPAEAATIPEVAEPESLARANAWSNFVLIAAQVLGGVALAPIVLKLAGAQAVFGIAVALFLVAAWQMAQVRTRRDSALEPAASSAPSLAEAAAPARWYSRYMVGWRAIREDPLMFGALARLTLLGTVLKVLVAVAPLLARRVLEIDAANTVYVMAPAALGSAAGLLLVAPLARVLSPNTVGRLAFVLFAVGVVALSVAEPLSEWLEARSAIRIEVIEDITRVPTLVTLVMLLAVFLGMTYALTSVAIRTLVNERAPRGLQGRVFATQQAVADTISLLPLVAAGALVDRIGVNPVLFAIGALCLIGEVMLTRRRRAEADGD
jgi:MFS family permease